MSGELDESAEQRAQRAKKTTTRAAHEDVDRGARPTDHAAQGQPREATAQVKDQWARASASRQTKAARNHPPR